MADQEQEFQEEEMWGVVLKQKERKEGFTTRKMRSFSSSSSSSCLSAAWQSPMHSAQEKMVSKNVTSEALQHKPSGPLKIPGCYNMQDSNNGDEYYVKNEEDEDEETMVPPHEYMAKKMARTRSASHSMCEGIGRTLKGRDLCKLRNAILTQTGFLEK